MQNAWVVPLVLEVDFYPQFGCPLFECLLWFWEYLVQKILMYKLLFQSTSLHPGNKLEENAAFVYRNLQ